MYVKSTVINEDLIQIIVKVFIAVVEIVLIDLLLKYRRVSFRKRKIVF